MEVKIYLESTDEGIKVTNHTSGTIHVELLNTVKNYCANGGRIHPGNFTNYFLKKDIFKEYKAANWINIIDSDYNLHCYVIRGSKIIKQEPKWDFDFNSPIICITGHAGGGTSVVSKSFRYFGANLGDDAGDFSNRKAHESICMRQVLHHIIPHIDNNDRIKDNIHQAMVGFGYKPNKVNAFKLTNISGISKRINEIFPNIKFLSMHKHQDPNPLTPEGKLYSRIKEMEIHKETYIPVEGAPMFVLDWARYFTDYKYAQKVLDYVGLDIELTPNRFNQMLLDIGFDKNKLKKK